MKGAKMKAIGIIILCVGCFWFGASLIAIIAVNKTSALERRIRFLLNKEEETDE